MRRKKKENKFGNKFGKLTDVSRLERRLSELQETVEKLQGMILRQEAFDQAPQLETNLLALKRFIPATSDGWLSVMMSGTRTALPSGLAISVTAQSGGRELGVISEGIYANNTFDVAQGHLLETFDRNSSVEMVFERAPTPVTIDGKIYDRRVTVSWVQGGSAKSIGPFPAMTDPANPTPTGTHDIEIADFPHKHGEQYGAYGMVWFRIGHQGDRYIHPGRVSLGCVTCAPTNWTAIYTVLNCGRTGDGKNVGKLKVL